MQVVDNFKSFAYPLIFLFFFMSDSCDGACSYWASDDEGGCFQLWSGVDGALDRASSFR
jgi:hypothetical protein